MIREEILNAKLHDHYFIFNTFASKDRLLSVFGPPLGL